MKKATDAQLIESYTRLKSVWKVAKEFCMCGQSVWERLKVLGFVDLDRWTNEELKELIWAYSVCRTDPVNINELATKLGRAKSNISRKARNLGLTSRIRQKSPEVCTQFSNRMKKWLEKNEHPRGAFKTGKEIRTCLHCGRFFEAFPSSKQKYCSRECGSSHPQGEGQAYSKGGKRSDLGGQYFRSRWEANYARFLNFTIQHGSDFLRWEYEPDTFEFTKIKKGTRFYTPDFKIFFSDGHFEYHEVKGWDYPKGRTARKRFLKYYPQFKLILIGREWFKSLKEQGYDKLIPNWEMG